jgi:hypothetical protein
MSEAHSLVSEIAEAYKLGADAQWQLDGDVLVIGYQPPSGKTFERSFNLASFQNDPEGCKRYVRHMFGAALRDIEYLRLGAA